MPKIHFTLPLHYISEKICPVDDRLVMHPNEILHQVLRAPHHTTRKIFYVVLSKDHTGEPDRFDYSVAYLDLFKGRKNIPSRGRAARNKIREYFQNISFKVHPKFVTTYLKKKVSEDPYINPFDMVDFVDGCWEIRLTRSFKTYLFVAQSMKESALHYTKGDIKLLLNLKNEHSDKIYWLIRREQWVRGMKTFPMDYLKELLGKPGSDTNNFLRQTMESIRKDLEGTWAEFTVRKIKKGNSIESVELVFDKDDVMLHRLNRDIKFDFEIALKKKGVNIPYIHLVRNRIINKETVKGKLRWSSFYVQYTLHKVSQRAKLGEVKSTPAYLMDALSKGHFAEEAYRYLTEKLPGYNKYYGDQLVEGISVQVEGIPYNKGEPVPEGMIVYENRMDWKRYLVPAESLSKVEKAYRSIVLY